MLLNVHVHVKYLLEGFDQTLLAGSGRELDSCFVCCTPVVVGSCWCFPTLPSVTNSWLLFGRLSNLLNSLVRGKSHEFWVCLLSIFRGVLTKSKVSSSLGDKHSGDTGGGDVILLLSLWLLFLLLFLFDPEEGGLRGTNSR